MNIFIAFIIALVATTFSLMLKKNNAELSLCISICASVTIFFISLDFIGDVIENLRGINTIQKEFFDIPLKLLGLMIMSRLCISICEDAGEKALANSVQTVTKFAIILIAFPLFEQLLSQLRTVLEL